jgi:NAD(P)H dehydrogenase (quinone)
MNNTILVTGATGYQGAAVVKELTQQSYNVKAMVHNNDSILDVEKVQANFDDAISLTKAFEGIEKVYLSFPLIFDKEKLLLFAANIVTAWQVSEVKQFVFNTNLPVQKEKVGLIAFDAKLAIENYFDAAGLPYISLRPTLYLDNLSAPFLLPVIQANSILPYPVPANKKIAWMSHIDLAKFVAATFKYPELIGKKFDIGGKQLLSGEEMASSISTIAGRHIQFIPVSPDDFEAQITPAFGAITAKEIANIYRFVKDNVEHLHAKDLHEKTLFALPVVLQSFDEWASEVQW